MTDIVPPIRFFFLQLLCAGNLSAYQLLFRCSTYFYKFYSLVSIYQKRMNLAAEKNSAKIIGENKFKKKSSNKNGDRTA